MALLVRFNLRPRGFTLLEVVVTIAILGLIFFLSTSGLSMLQRSFAAQVVDREVVNVLSNAARRARIGMGGGDWGVHIPYDATTRVATTLTLFHGSSYADRIVADDQSYPINIQARFVVVDLNGPAPATGNDHEIVFHSLSGETVQYGEIVVEWYEQRRTITIDPDGFAVRSPL